MIIHGVSLATAILKRDMTKAQQTLKEDIEKIKDDTTIEKVRIFIMGILAQQSISENQRNPTK